jgi:TolB protein
MKKFLLFTLVALTVTACLPQNVQIPQSPLLSTLERKSGLIAYIGIDGNMYVSDQGGGNLIQFSDDANVDSNESAPFRFYQFPSWSRDGKQLAYVRRAGVGDQISSGLLVANIDDESVDEVYKSDSEHPFYLYWSPDRQNVGFLSTSVPGESFILQSVPVSGGERIIVDTGSPYYWSWAPDGSAMVVHAGGANSSTPEHLSFLQMDSEVIEDRLDSVPASFQAPAWSPDGSRILISRLNDDNEKELILTDGSGAFQNTVDTFGINVSFAWSNDSNHFAYITSDVDMGAGVIGTMHVMDLTNGVEDVFQDENVVSFFWSPDNSMLAYFKPFFSEAASENGTDGSGQALSLQLNVVDVASGESRELNSFVPTQEFVSILPYFDQYHQSTTIWSPDNNNLVLSFTQSNGSPGIAIVAASGQLEPRLLAEGYLAFWSWK